jgi:hypothetical protein
LSAHAIMICDVVSTSKSGMIGSLSGNVFSTRRAWTETFANI